MEKILVLILPFVLCQCSSMEKSIGLSVGIGAASKEMPMIRFIFWLWGIVVLCGVIDSAMIALNDGKFPQPISYKWWTDQLLKGHTKVRHP